MIVLINHVLLLLLSYFKNYIPNKNGVSSVIMIEWLLFEILILNFIKFQ